MDAKLKVKLVVTQVTLTPGKETVTLQVQISLVDDTGKEVLSFPLPYGAMNKEVSADIASRFAVGAEFTS